MKLPRETAIMTLPNVTLFPQSLLPLYIFEPRYRQMLADALHTNRMFAVAMQKPGNSREVPMPVAGLGLVRVAVGHRDGTSHLILQGIARVELQRAVKYKPFRIHKIRPLPTPPSDTTATDALLEKVRELLHERIRLGLPFTFPVMPSLQPGNEAPVGPSPTLSAKEILGYLVSINEPDQAVDLVSCAVLPNASERQTILETVDVESRLRVLIHFLVTEIRKRQKGSGSQLA
ncbi:MAG TPA: LON peptidase substrate-binding domain-containing protein [Candidatus Paceibacterota bacterium]|nr:LON peptidase substrate-binding domain-containing protein [Candidatus Paceibacterota bacterium]